MHLFRFISIVLISTLCSCDTSNEPGITIKDLWINEAPPNMTVLAAYGVINNNTRSDLVLEKIISPQFEEIEIHSIMMQDDVSKMVKQDNLPIQKQSNVVFSPGGFHIMLYDPKTPVKKDQYFPFVFYFSDGSQIETNAIVKKLSGASNHDHHHHHHH